MTNKKLYKLCFYVPESHLDAVKQAVFAAGAGTIGHYEYCCWQSKGQGQFKPVEGSHPFIGKQDELTQVDEYKVEMVCDGRHIKSAIAALKLAHPFEEPAYQAWEIFDV